MRLSRSRWVVLLAALAMAALTARLGGWQLDRAAQKTALQQALERQLALPPLTSAPQDSDQAAAHLHRSLRLSGQWLPAHTVVLDNRQMNGRPGFYVLTPLLLDDGHALLVQRGWLPRDFLDRTRVAAPLPPVGTVTVEGRVAGAPARLHEFEASGPGGGPIRQNLALGDYAAETGLKLLPLTLLQRQTGPADGLLRQWPQPADWQAGVHKHYGYAFQWFALSALVIGLYVWFQILRPHLQRKRH